jgi:hypothetical protein
MLSLLGYISWILIPLLEVGVVVCAIRAKCFLQFFPLNFYMLAASFVAAARYFVFNHYGLRSAEYFYFYYISDALLTICLFFALMGLFSHVFSEMGAALYVRLAAIGVLGLSAVVSYAIVWHSQDKIFAHSQGKIATYFVSEMLQNLHFIEAILAYVLWGAIRKLHETRTRLIQLSLALGVFLSAMAASNALSALYPNSPIWRIGSYLMSLWLPIAWGYTFLRVPENARLAPSRVVTGRPSPVAGS